MLWRYTLVGHEVKVEPDVLAWAQWFEKADRRVAEDFIGDVRVSTVFLGLDHDFGMRGPPILFETMVFNGPLDGKQRRYETWEQAESGHDDLVAEIKGPGPEEGIRKIRRPFKRKGEVK